MSDIEEFIIEDTYEKTMVDRLLNLMFCAVKLVIVVSISVVATFLALKLVEIAH